MRVHVNSFNYLKHRTTLLSYLTLFLCLTYFVLYTLTNRFFVCPNNRLKVGRGKSGVLFNGRQSRLLNVDNQRILQEIKLKVENGGCSGLGNMMFRIAAMVEFGKVLKRKPCLQSNLCAKNYLPELTLAFPNLPKNIFMTRCSRKDPKTELIPFAQKCWKFDNISRLSPLNKQQNVLEIDSSYLQSFKFFKRDISRRLFEFSPLVRHYVDSYTKVLFEGADELPKFCVHLRGGDFSDHILLPSEIDSAFASINYLLKKYTVDGLCWLLLFSDDARISNQLEDLVKNISSNTQTHIVTALSRTESLYLASASCDVFLLTSPGSTFGWWAAYLIEDRKQDQVYYIDRFFKPEFLSEYLEDFDENDFFPPQWQRLNILMDDVFSSRTTGIYDNILFS